MKYICTFPCQFRGVRVRQDTVLDISDAEAKSDVVKSSFRPYDVARGVATGDDENERDQFGMTKQNYRDKLAPFGAVWQPTDTLDQLRKTYERLTSDQSRKQRAKPQ